MWRMGIGLEKNMPPPRYYASYFLCGGATIVMLAIVIWLGRNPPETGILPWIALLVVPVITCGIVGHRRRKKKEEELL